MLTKDQRRFDGVFINLVNERYILPLLDELHNGIDGFGDMDFQDRYIRVIELNEPFFYKGDALLLPHTLGGMYVFAGERLRKQPVSLSDLASGIKIDQYQPRFRNNFLYGSWDNGIAEIPGADPPEYASAIKVFLEYETKAYKKLPPSYKAALLVQYICENVNVAPEDATAFVLGCFPDLSGQRWIARVTKNGDEVGNGWVIRIRDLKPSVAFGRELARNLTCAMDDIVRSDSLPTELQMRSEKTNAKKVFDYIDDEYKAPHIYIGPLNRGNDMSWNQVLEDIRKNVPEANDYGGQGRNLKDSYEKSRGAYPYTYKSKADKAAKEARR